MSSGAHVLLGLLIKNELVIRELYETFAKMFPDHHSFWHRIALDEKKHADWLEMLRFEPILNDAFLKDFAVKPQTIESSISYIEQLIEKAQGGHYRLLEALCLARDIENSLLEKQFSNISNSVPEEIRLVLMQLADDTQRHRNELMATLNSATQ